MGWLENNNRQMTREEAVEFGLIEEGSDKQCAFQSDEYVYIHNVKVEVFKDLSDVRDSMMLDSGTTIATLKDETKGRTASLEVRGGVRVDWCPDGDIETYMAPSDFPKELKELISTKPLWDLDPRVYVDESNWFEVFVEEMGEDGDSVLLACEIVDVENKTPEELKKFLIEVYEEVCEEEYNQSEYFQENSEIEEER